MSILITIPSKKRASTILRDTFSWLRFSAYPVTIFVEQDDLEEYRSVLQVIHGTKLNCSLVVLPESNRGINYARWYIQKHCQAKGVKYIFQIDDDVHSFRDPVNGRGKGAKQPRIDKRYRCENIFDPLIKNCVELLDSMPDVGAISLMYGQDMITYTGEMWTAVNKRLQTNYIIRTELAHTAGCEKFNGVFADFTTFFNLLHLGYTTVQYGLTGFDVRPVGVHKGGLQNFDRRKAAELQKAFIEKKFPWVVWKQVENKAWDWEPDMRKTLKQYQKL